MNIYTFNERIVIPLNKLEYMAMEEDYLTIIIATSSNKFTITHVDKTECREHFKKMQESLLEHKL